MAQKIQDGKLFYHITAIDNLKTILKHGLLSRNDAISKGLLQKDIADFEIIEKRQQIGIDSYVPFHFFEKTPFTGAVLKRHKDTTFCAITIKREFAKANGFKICTSHPLSPTAKILNYDQGLKFIDWENMEKRDYSDENCKNACMAECLASSPVFPKDFQSIYVPDDTTRLSVENLAKKVLVNYNFFIDVNPNFTKVNQDD